MSKKQSKKVSRVLTVNSPTSAAYPAHPAHPPIRGERGREAGPRRKNSRAKGAVGERELAGVLCAAGFPGSKRGQQRSGLEQADVIGVEGWHIECKRVEALNVWAAFEQATRDAADGDIPMVAMRRNRGPWLAVVDLNVLLAYIQREAIDRQFLGPLAEDLDFLTAWNE